MDVYAGTQEVLAFADASGDVVARRVAGVGAEFGDSALHLYDFLMRVLGISAFYHDSAAALIEDGQPIAAAQEERFSRKKHDERFPRNAVAYCLRERGISLDALD